MPYVAPEAALSASSAGIGVVSGAQGESPWRIPLLANPDTRVVLICWNPGYRSIPHHHPSATETFQVISGRLGFRLDDRADVEAGPGTVLIAHRGQVHGLSVLGAEPLLFLASVSPNRDVADEQVDVPEMWSDWRGSPMPQGGVR